MLNRIVFQALKAFQNLKPRTTGLADGPRFAQTFSRPGELTPTVGGYLGAPGNRLNLFA
jgi:hypothetical protein